MQFPREPKRAPDRSHRTTVKQSLNAAETINHFTTVLWTVVAIEEFAHSTSVRVASCHEYLSEFCGRPVV